MKKIPMLEKFAAQSLVELDGELIFSKEKFAELIVRECVKCCEQVISDPVPESVDTWLNGGSQCMAEIKQHFGVEE
jgi:hypothetical protein